MGLHLLILSETHLPSFSISKKHSGSTMSQLFLRRIFDEHVGLRKGPNSARDKMDLQVQTSVNDGHGGAKSSTVMDPSM